MRSSPSPPPGEPAGRVADGGRRARARRAHPARGDPSGGGTWGAQLPLPERLRFLLDGRDGIGAAPAVSGYGDRPYLDLTVDNLAVSSGGIQALAAAWKAADRRCPAPPDRRAHGGAAAEHYVLTARKLSRWLTRVGFFGADPLAELPLPGRPGAGRDHGLDDEELCEYLHQVLVHSRDPKLDALLSTFWRVTAARLIEVLDAGCVRDGARLRGQPPGAPVTTRRPLRS